MARGVGVNTHLGSLVFILSQDSMKRIAFNLLTDVIGFHYIDTLVLVDVYTES